MASTMIDPVTKARRVIVVDGGGSDIFTPPAVFAEDILRYNTPGTRTVGAGKTSYSVYVRTASSASSPTLNGIPLPEGYSGEWTAPPGSTLTGRSLVTASTDDVYVTVV